MTTDVRSNAPGDHDAIDLEAVYPHPVELVWRALTEPAALATWLMTNDFQAKVGHRFTFRTDPALAPLRDLLGGGWRSKLLAITLPDLLGRLAAGSRSQGAP